MGNLILMRHAKSDWSTDALTDFERPLNARGKRNAKTMAHWIATELPHPDLIVSSPSERTQQTVARVCERLSYPLERVRWEHSVYEASLESLLNVLRIIPDEAETLMLVGHNPGMEMLKTYLCADDQQNPTAEKQFPTAAVAHLRSEGRWRELDHGCAAMIRLVRPRELDGS